MTKDQVKQIAEVIWENDLNERVDSMIDQAIDQVRDAGNLARQRWLLS